MALMHKVTLKEVEDGIKELARKKAHGQDGFMGKFFQETLRFIGQDILVVVVHSRKFQKLNQALNSYVISLIPKTSQSEEPQGFIPISLCDVKYIVIYMMMDKRLKPLLSNLISPEQASFVQGRKFLDGIITT